jgi:DNA-binding response OmpR family regulator
LLRHAGFAVERVHAGEQLGARADRIGIRIVVVSCGPPAAGVAPLAGFRPAPGHLYTLVALVHDDGATARAAGADHVVRLPFDPGAFVDELLAVMR